MGKLRQKLHTRAFSLLKVTEVQLKRLGGSQPLCSSQWRIAVPETERERDSMRGEEQTAAERRLEGSFVYCHDFMVI